AGQQQRLAAQVENLKVSLGQKLLPIFTRVMKFITGTVVPWLQRNKDTVAKLGAAIVGLAGFVLTVNSAYKVFDATMKVVRGSTLLLTAATKSWTVVQRVAKAVMAMSPLGRIIALVTALAGVVVAVGAKMGWLKDVWSAVTGAVASAAKWVGDKVVGAWNWVWSRLKSVFSAIKSFARGLWDGLVGGLKAAINGIIHVLNWGIDGINMVIKGVNYLPGVDIGLISHIPKLHTGGVVPGAPGQEVMTLLQAGEKVTRAGAQPKTVAITGGDAFGDLMVETLRKYTRQHGGDVQFVL